MTMTAEKLIDPAFVVFGIDAAKKPRAARFDNSQPKLVAKAAELMKLQVCEVSSPAVAAVAKKLPEGRLYANGNGFIPSVRHGVYATLAATIAAANRAVGIKGAGAAAGSPGLPQSWDQIGPGHLVIANEGAGQGWWDAIVVAVDGDMLTLHWRDFPWAPDVVQHRSTVALIKPGQ